MLYPRLPDMCRWIYRTWPAATSMHCTQRICFAISAITTTCSRAISICTETLSYHTKYVCCECHWYSCTSLVLLLYMYACFLILLRLLLKFDCRIFNLRIFPNYNVVAGSGDLSALHTGCRFYVHLCGCGKIGRWRLRRRSLPSQRSSERWRCHAHSDVRQRWRHAWHAGFQPIRRRRYEGLRVILISNISIL